MGITLATAFIHHRGANLTIRRFKRDLKSAIQNTLKLVRDGLWIENQTAQIKTVPYGGDAHQYNQIKSQMNNSEISAPMQQTKITTMTTPTGSRQNPN